MSFHTLIRVLVYSKNLSYKFPFSYCACIDRNSWAGFRRILSGYALRFAHVLTKFMHVSKQIVRLYHAHATINCAYKIDMDILLGGTYIVHINGL